MTKYRKKPVVIEAVQWNGQRDAKKALLPFESGARECFITTSDELAIKTLEGVMIASVGDWIIKGVKGEIYPCKPDIFEETYEKVEDGEGLE